MGEIVCNKCCCCIDLKKGCFIIAYLHLITCVCLAIFFIVALIFGGEMMNENFPDPRIRREEITLMIYAVYTLILELIQLISVIRLIVGLHKNKPKLVEEYLGVVFLILSINIVCFINLVTSGKADDIDVAVNLLDFILRIYIIVVMGSQHEVMITLEPGAAMNDAA